MSFFWRSPVHELQAAALGALLRQCGLLAHAQVLYRPDLDEVARFCDVYETFCNLCPTTVITFEHAWYLLQVLARLDEFVLARCPDCLESLTQRAGNAAMAGTTIVWPGVRLQPGDALRVGRLTLQVLDREQGHTASDLVLWMPQHRVLWAGGLAYGGRLPELAQGSVEQWLAALDRLQRLQPLRVVGSRVGDAGLLDATQLYLQTLRSRVLAAMDAGRHAGELQSVRLDEWAGWAGFAERQGFNTQRAWRELEPVWMDQATAPGAAPAPPASVEQVGR